MKPDKKKYLMVLLITTGIFIVVFMLVSFLNSRKVDTVEQLQQKITVDLLATETQFALLKNTPCKTIKNSILSKELGELGEKLSFMESTQGSDNDSVLQLKKYYSLLQVKDYLLMQEVAEKCDIQTDSIVYFYEQDCSDCVKQGYVLTELKRQYPWLRIYSFDRNLDFSLINTFEELYGFKDTYPVLIIGEDTYPGFKKIADVEAFIPTLQIKKELEDIQKNSLSFLMDQEIFEDIEYFTFLDYTDGIVHYSYISLDDGGGSLDSKDEVLDIEKVMFIDLMYDAETEIFSLEEEK